MSNITLCFIHGLPASGKDTQANLLLSVIPHSTIVSGVYRSALTKKEPYAKYYDQITPFIKPLGQGIEIPGKVVADVLAGIIQDGKSAGINTFLICGILRTIDHKRAIDELVMGNSELCAKHILLNVSIERALNQARTRLERGNSEGTARIDDSDQYMLARLRRYKTNILPMLEELEKNEELKTIEANRTINKIYLDLKSYIISEISIIESEETFTDNARKNNHQEV